MANRITSAAKIAVTGKTPGDRRAELYAQRERAEAKKVEANAMRRAVFAEADALAEQIKQAQVDAMRTGDETELEALFDRRDELVGPGGQLLGLFSKFDGLDNGVPAGGLLAQARAQEAVATRAVHEVDMDLADLHSKERGWFRREADALVDDYREHMRLAASAIADAEAMRDDLRELSNDVVAGHRRAGHRSADVCIGELVGARTELERALDSTGFRGLDER